MNKVLLLLMLTGCGIDVHVDQIETKPIKVTHTITIDYNGVLNYCNNKCVAQSSDPAVVQQCTNDCFNQFVDIVNNATL